MRKFVCASGEVCYGYQEYLNSGHWCNKKQELRESGKATGSCFICGSRKNINVHHRTYANIGNENLNDLVELCRKCHIKVHQLVKNTTEFDRWRECIDICFAVEYFKSKRKHRTKPKTRNGPKHKRIAGMLFKV